MISQDNTRGRKVKEEKTPGKVKTTEKRGHNPSIIPGSAVNDIYIVIQTWVTDFITA